jgi:peptidase C39-like protein
LVCAWLAGCAALVPQSSALREQWPADLPAHAELSNVPFFPQRDYQCGPAALAMSLASLNVPVTTEALIPEVYLPERHGSLQVEMLAAARRHGMVSYQLAPKFEDLLQEVATGTPVVVLNNLAQTLSDEGRNEEALTLIDRAVALGGRFSSAATETSAAIVERMTSQSSNTER